MADFAELDQNNVVLRVISIADAVIDPPGPNDTAEGKGIAFCKKLYGANTKWKMVDGNNTGRAGKGYKVNGNNGKFMYPQPYPSWTYNGIRNVWEPPVPIPPNGGKKHWNEQTQTWDDPQV